jgi:hypothetical protein
LHQRQQQNCWCNQYGELLVSAMSLHDQVPPRATVGCSLRLCVSHRACSVSSLDLNYLSVFTKSAIAWAWSFVSPAIPLL